MRPFVPLFRTSALHRSLRQPLYDDMLVLRRPRVSPDRSEEFGCTLLKDRPQTEPVQPVRLPKHVSARPVPHEPVGRAEQGTYSRETCEEGP
jgi:hypothetical protein